MIIRFLKKINRWRIDQMAAVGRIYDKHKKGPKAVVLLYHRVSALAHDPLMLTVTPAHFYEHLKELKKHFEIISTGELLARLMNHGLNGTELAITFDDGYRDNMTEALPIAEKYEVPFTVFVATGTLENPPISYPWDNLYSNNVRSYLSANDIQELASKSIVTLGAHTVSHPRLRDLPERLQGEEIKLSKKKLESLTHLPVSYFAYPYGGKLDFTAQTKKQARLSGMTAAFATGDRIIGYGQDIYAIPRINVRDQTGKELIDKIKQYL